jgi:hypothetical protein
MAEQIARWTANVKGSCCNALPLKHPADSWTCPVFQLELGPEGFNPRNDRLNLVLGR